MDKTIASRDPDGARHDTYMHVIRIISIIGTIIMVPASSFFAINLKIYHKLSGDSQREPYFFRFVERASLILKCSF